MQGWCGSLSLSDSSGRVHQGQLARVERVGLGQHLGPVLVHAQARAVDLQRGQGHRAVHEDRHVAGPGPRRPAPGSRAAARECGRPRTPGPARPAAAQHPAEHRAELVGAAGLVPAVAVRRLHDHVVDRRQRLGRPRSSGWSGRPRSPLNATVTPPTSSTAKREPRMCPARCRVTPMSPTLVSSPVGSGRSRASARSASAVSYRGRGSACLDTRRSVPSAPPPPAGGRRRGARSAAAARSRGCRGSVRRSPRAPSPAGSRSGRGARG